jgi:hypothetical protein
MSAEGKMTGKSKALCVTAKRLEGSPPPELPNYACDCAAKEKRCKYVFRNQKVICGNQTQGHNRKKILVL